MVNKDIFTKLAVIFAIVLSCLQLTACVATPEVRTSMARFDSPEVSRKPFKVKLAVGTDSQNEIPLATDESANMSHITRLSAAMALGYGVELKYSYAEASKLSIKYQLLGAPLDEKLPGNVSLAASVAFIHASPSDRYILNSEIYDPEAELYKRNWKSTHKTLDFALIGGHRITNAALLYGSLFYQDGDVRGQTYITPRDIENYSLCDDNDPCIIEYFNSDGKAYGANLGLEYEIKPWFVISGELVHHKAQWFDRNSSQTGANVNFEFRL